MVNPESRKRKLIFNSEILSFVCYLSLTNVHISFSRRNCSRRWFRFPPLVALLVAGCVVGAGGRPRDGSLPWGQYLMGGKESLNEAVCTFQNIHKHSGLIRNQVILQKIHNCAIVPFLAWFYTYSKSTHWTKCNARFPKNA
jgi:hypothetical protein